MSLFVHKYGGSSVADADKIVNVARRIAGVHDEGHQVVTVVSAMGDTTDELIDLARTVADQPDPRELDLLLSTGNWSPSPCCRWRCEILAMTPSV